MKLYLLVFVILTIVFSFMNFGILFLKGDITDEDSLGDLLLTYIYTLPISVITSLLFSYLVAGSITRTMINPKTQYVLVDEVEVQWISSDGSKYRIESDEGYYKYVVVEGYDIRVYDDTNDEYVIEYYKEQFVNNNGWYFSFAYPFKKYTEVHIPKNRSKNDG